MELKIENSGYIDRRGRKYKRISHEQRVELRKISAAHIPFWRRPLIGYSVSVLLIGACAYGLHYMVNVATLNVYSPASVLMLPLILIALFWGVGPSLIALLVGTAALIYLFIPSIRPFDMHSWSNAIQLLPFVVTGLIVALITAQRERERLNALIADLELQAYARHLEEANQKLEDANQTKDHFMSIASHELKTPITTIRGQTQLLMRRITKQEEVSPDISPEMRDIHHTLNRINEQTGRLTSLIEELLDVSSIRNGKIELRKKKQDLRKICQEVVSDEQMVSGRSISLTIPPEEVCVTVDGDRISQVMTNLVSNAVKYSPDDSPIDVELFQKKGSAFLRVRDYGKGIAPDQQQRIFEPFYRSPDAKSSSKKGLGLGLAISKEIVVRHGGRIWCESKPGEGSTFVVELPSQ